MLTTVDPSSLERRFILLFVERMGHLTYSHKIDYLMRQEHISTHVRLRGEWRGAHGSEVGGSRAVK